MKYSTIGRYKISAKTFVSTWSAKYREIEGRRKGVKERYSKNINIRPLTKRSVKELIKWKNGYNDKIAAAKMPLVQSFLSKIDLVNKLSKNWNYKTFKEGFNPEGNGPIW